MKVIEHTWDCNIVIVNLRRGAGTTGVRGAMAHSGYNKLSVIQKCAWAGNRTRASWFEGSNANHYTKMLLTRLKKP